MRYRIIILMFTLYSYLSCQDKSQKIFEMNSVEIDSILQVIGKSNLTVTEKMNYYSEIFLDMPYNLTCTGDGPYALYEPEPLLNLTNTNCMVYCEHVLALSISDSWDNFFNNLQQIRYKDGIIGMRTRNHYTMADWLPQNNWLLEDVSRKVGNTDTESVTRLISHKQFFKKKGITDLRYIQPDREISIDYVPFNELLKNSDKMADGDILALIFSGKDDIFSAHMLMFYVKRGDKFIRESSMSKMTTFETPIDEWIDKYRNSTKYLGVSIMRVKQDLNKPGKVILPWEINELKNF
ncbi:N-acetylmuramoyl-L-alanine amidase-like domain-containing protein [Bacteroidota bacterium]